MSCLDGRTALFSFEHGFGLIAFTRKELPSYDCHGSPTIELDDALRALHTRKTAAMPLDPSLNNGASTIWWLSIEKIKISL